MATNFPNSLDSFTNPSPTDSMATVSHADQHANVNDAVEAIEAALLDGSPLKIDDANNRVGVGTPSPSTSLHVSSGTAGDCELRIEADTDNNDEADSPAISFAADGGILEAVIGLDNNLLRVVSSVSSNSGISFCVGPTNVYTNAADVILAAPERMRIDSSGIVRSNTAAVFTPLTTPQVYEFGSTGASGGPVSLTGLPTTTRAIIANVFVTSASDDHFNTNFKGGSSIANYQNWVNTRGTQPSSIFGNLAATNAMGALHTYYGQLDGFTSNYGIWQQLVIPMYGSRNLYWNSYGASSTQRWYYVQVIAYADGV